MDDQISNDRPSPGTPTSTSTDVTRAADELLSDDLLVEEISIDGMCGVY